MKKRLDSIDVMRTTAIVFMVLCHFVIFLSPVNGAYPWVYFFANHVIGDIAAPIFVFLVGMSQAISQSKKPSTGKLLDAGGIRTVRRGGLIILTGLFFSLSTRGVDSLLEWDILTFIGMALIILFFLRNAPVWLLGLVALAAYVAAPWCRELTHYSLYWGPPVDDPAMTKVLAGLLLDPSREYQMDFNPTHIVAGIVAVGYFPLVPWLACTVVGFALGKFSLTGERIGRWDGAAGVAGVVCLGGGAGGAYYATQAGIRTVESGYLVPLSFYPATPTHFLVQLGICLILFWACRRWFDRTAQDSWLRGYCRLTSRMSLTIYVMHHYVMLWPLWVAGWLAGDRLKYYENAMNAITAFGLGLVCLAGFYLLFRWWDRHENRYSFEWLIEKLNPK